MSRLVVALHLLALGMPVLASSAQAPERTVIVTVSPSYVAYDPLGSFPAVVAQLGARHAFNSTFGGELAAFALGTLGGATAIPDCPAGVSCVTRSTPNAITGVLASMLASVGTSALGVSLGIGAVTAMGGEGLDNRSAGAASIGLEWIPRTTSRWVPMVGIRYVQLASPIAGMRHLVVPGIGVAF